jgi:IS5 family transposase
MMKPRISLFAEHERENRRAKLGDPLVGLAKYVDFEALAATIDEAAPRPSRSKGARPPYPTLLVIKILVLQQLYNLADDALEYQLLDRRSLLQFLDLTDSSSIPDAKTIWLFRDRLAQAGVGNPIFEQVQQQLAWQGYMARCGQIVDASLVQAPTQRNKREEARPLSRAPCRWNGNRASALRKMSTRSGPKSMARITSATSSTPAWTSAAS